MSTNQTIEEAIKTISIFADIRIDRLKDGRFMVSLYPRNHGNLWWYGIDDSLKTALNICISKSKDFGFLR